MKINEILLLSWLLFAPCFLMSQEMGSLKVTFAVKGGKLVVDTSEFKANGIPFPTTAQTDLVTFLNRSFAELDSLVENGSTLWPFPDMPPQPLDEVFNEGYGYLTGQDGVGREVANAFNEQVMTNGSDLALRDFLEVYLFGPLASNLWIYSPLSLNLEGLLQSTYQKMQFEFAIKPPLSLDHYAIQWDGDKRLPKRRTHKILKGMDGQLYFRSKIKKRVERYFMLTKYLPSYVITDSMVYVQPARLTQITVKTADKDEVRKVLYHLLPAKYFKKATQVPVDSLPVSENGGGYIFSLYDYVNGDRKKLPKIQTDLLQIAQMQLGKINYTLGPPDESDWLEVSDVEKGSYLQYVVSQVSVDSSTMQCAKRIPATNKEGVTSASDLPTDHPTFDNDRIDTTEEKCGKPLRNTFGAGFNYAFGDGADVFFNLERKMADQHSFSLQAGWAFNENGIKEGGLFFSGNYFKDYLFFNALHKKMSFQLTGQSAYTTNRVLQGVEAKERRTGGKAQLQLDWFRDANGNQLSTYMNLQRQKLSLQDFEDATISDMTLSFLEIGKTWFLGKSGTYRTSYLLVEPGLKLGIAEDGNGGEAKNYIVSNIRFNWQRLWPGGFGYTLGGYWQHASVHAPLPELPALNTSINRGFRQDDVIADELVGFQPEIWVPLPRFGKNPGGFNEYLFRRVRLALFADGTWIAGGPNRAKDFLLSPGLGLRFVEFPAQVNFDWAWGIAPNNLNIGKSRFSLSLTLKAPI